MFEGILEKFLQSYLGKYLEGLESQNLNVGIWSGNILLENLRVRPSLFENSKLPLKVKFGLIKKIHIIVPWTRLSSSPVEITIESLMLIVVPQSSDEWQSFDETTFEFKQKMLDEFAQSFARHLRLQILQKGEQKEDGYFDRLLIKIVDNLQLKIKNIHVRYEDKQTIKGQPFSFGLTLKELTVNTTNSEWEPTFYDRNLNENKDKPVYKNLKITSFAYYLNHFDHFLLSNQMKDEVEGERDEEQEEFIAYKMGTMFPIDADMVENTPYLIQPIQLELKMIQLTKTEIERPMFHFEIVLGELSVVIKKKQYEIIFKIAEYVRQYDKFLDKANATQKYKFLRPIFPLEYDDSKTISIIQRRLNERFSKKIFPQKIQDKEESKQIIKVGEDEDEDEFFDALDEIPVNMEDTTVESSPHHVESPGKKDEEKKDSKYKNKHFTNMNAVEWWQFAIQSVQKDIRLNKGVWNEFKITNYRKNLFRKFIFVLLHKCFNEECNIKYENLKEEERLLYRHIICATDVSDIKNWISIVLKRKIEREKAQKDQSKTVLSYLFSWGGSKKQEESKSDILNKDDFQLTDAELNTIKQSLAEIQFFDVNELEISSEDKKKLVKFHVNCVFTKSKILIDDKRIGIEVYQDYFSVDLQLRRDFGFDLVVRNKDAGINFITYPEKQPDMPIVKPLVKKLINQHQKQEGQEEEEKVPHNELDDILWQFKFIKNSALSNLPDEILFDSNALKVIYDAATIQQIKGFFKLDSTEELKAQALDKLSAIKDQTQLSIQDLFYKKETKICIRVSAPVIMIPFKAANSALIGEPESQRDRTWCVNLGTFTFTTNNQQTISIETLDEYEQFNIALDSLKLQYYKMDKCVNVIDDLKLSLSIKIRNKLKQAILKGNHDQDVVQDNQEQKQADVKINAQLTSLNANFTPDVYNSLVNIMEVISSEGAEVELLQLKYEKDQIVKNSTFKMITSARGVRNFMSYWQDYYVVMSGSYIYFYKNQRDLMPHHYIYIGDCLHQLEISPQELKAINSAELDPKNFIIITAKKEKIYLAFNSIVDKEKFTQSLVNKEKEMRGNNLKRSFEVLSDIIHKDSKALGFSLELQVNNISLSIYKTSEEAYESQYKQICQPWVRAQITNVKFKLEKYVFEIYLFFTLEQIKISECRNLNEDIIMNEAGQVLVELEIIVYDIYSPTLDDSQIIVNLRLGKLLILFEPMIVNEIVKFFRNVRTVNIVDMESFQQSLMNDQENSGASNQKQEHQHIDQTCKTISAILVKVNVEAQGLDIVCIHHEYYSPFMELTVGYSNFKHKMMYDHDIIEGSFGNARVYDLTNYPKTFLPSADNKGSIYKLDQLVRQEIVGIRDPGFGQEGSQNTIWFQSIIYQEHCPLHKPQTYSSLKLDVSKAKILYCYEMSFRIIDYFFDKFLWSFTDTEPYEDMEARKKRKEEKIDLDNMETSQLYDFDLQQDLTMMEMEVKIHRPHVIIKDRPYSQQSLEFDLGEITMQNEYKIIKNRFKGAPFKDIHMTSLLLDAKDLGIRSKLDDFAIAEPFDIKMNFSYLSYSQLLPQIDSKSLDKSFSVELDFKPSLGLRMRQDTYTFILRCLDLNFAYTDYNDLKFNFRNEEEYFRSTDYILKSRVKMNIPLLFFSLYDQNELLTEILFKKPQIIIDYYLNRRCNYEIIVQQLGMLYLKSLSTKQLLLGNLTHRHRVPILESYEDTFSNNQQREDIRALQMTIAMFPNGKKDFQIKGGDLKMFLQPYFFLMLDHFFREGIPQYEESAFDKPNEYDSNYETYPEMHLNVNLKNSLLCFSSESLQDNKAIACQCNLEYEYKREKIRKIKKSIVNKLESVSSLQDQEQQSDFQLPITWMRLQFFDFCPFICELTDLEIFEFNIVRKRQLITPFNMSYFYAQYLSFKQGASKLSLFDKSEIKMDKTVVKVSYNDFVLLQTLNGKFMEHYQKFNTFFIKYEQQKVENLRQSQMRIQRQEVEQGAAELEANLFKQTQKAIRMLTSYTMKQTKNQEENKKSEIESEDNQKRSQLIQEDLMDQVLDYENIETKIFRAQSSGIQIVIINDYNNVFYPVLSINVQHFRFKYQEEAGRTVGETHLKAMISYYNAHAGEWEPLIEKTELHVLVDACGGQKNILISFQKNLNINITDMLMQTLIETYRSLKGRGDTNTQVEQSHSLLSDLRTSRITQSVSDNQFQQNQVEFKVTPYTIVNYTSKKITIRRVFDKQGMNPINQHIPKEYIIMPGGQVEYEVDYEDEAKQLMRITRDELVRKCDFVNVIFEDGSKKEFKIDGLNLRDMRTYIHDFTKTKDDYIAYGVQFENMRKVLNLRAPYVINNRTDCDYMLRLITPDSEQVIHLKSRQSLPIGLADANKKFQICNVQNNLEEWSKPIKIATIIERLPKNATTFLFHGNQYSIIIKEKSELTRSYNINIKTPVVIKNALPCNLKIKVKIIKGIQSKALDQLDHAQKPKYFKEAAKQQQDKKEEEDLIFEEQEFFIRKGQQLQLYDFNLKGQVSFFFQLDQNCHSEFEPQNKGFQWTEALFKNKEFKSNKVFLIKDCNLQSSLEVYAETKKSSNAGVQITFYVKNCIINNTDQKLSIYYDKKTPAAGLTSENDNSVILLSDKSKVIVCIENNDGVKNFSDPFLIDVAAVTNTIKVRKELNITYEFTVKTELSLASNDEDLYTKVTTVSPCYVLNNKTKMTLLITQEDCLDEHQVVEAGMRIPFFWRDIRKPRLAKLKCVQTEGLDKDDKSHEWSFGFSLSELGRLTILNRNLTSQSMNKHIVIDKQLQEQHEIVYITFEEENLKYPTYKIENRTEMIKFEFYQKDHPHNSYTLNPKQSQIFSWANTQADYKVTCKFSYIDALQQEGVCVKQDLEIDNLGLKQKIPLPPPQDQSTSRANKIKQKPKFIYADIQTTGFTKTLRISEEPLDANQNDFDDITQEEEKKGNDQQQDDEEQLQVDTQLKTINVQISAIGLSLICRTYQGIRKEFAFFYFENLKFIVLETHKKRQVQLKISYVQIDNNIGHKQIFPIILYPKELVKRRDALKMKKYKKDSKKQEAILNKDFFNAHCSMRKDIPNIWFFEKIEFLVQTMILQMDDELIGFFVKFTTNIAEQMKTNITGVHEVFVQASKKFKDYDEIEIETYELEQEEEEKRSGKGKRFLHQINEDEDEDDIFNTLEKKQNEEEKQGNYDDAKDNEDFFNKQKMLSKLKVKRTQEGRSLRQPRTFSETQPQHPKSKRPSSGSHVSSFMLPNQFTKLNQKSWLNYQLEDKNKRLYIKEYKSSPLEIEVSFLTRVKMDIDLADKKFSLKDKLKIFGLVLTNMDKAPLRINSLVTSNIFGSPQEIMFLLKSHYVARMKKNLFTMIGSSSILGNPANFISHLGTGVQDFFYKPIEGIVKGPLEGGKGLIQGTGSLIKNTVQGTFGSASKMLSSVSKGLLFITDDVDYINKREEENLDRPKNALEGVGYGLKSTFTGIASGITGVFENPYKGAQKDGVKGFIVGTYKGMSGLVVKPLSGALDFFSKTSEGIKNTATSSQQQIVKIRTMRPFYGRLQLIKSYDEFHAFVTQHLKKINRGKYQNDQFIDALYYDTPKERLVIVLTEEHLLLVDSNTREIVNEYLSKDLYTIKKKNDNTLSLFTEKNVEALQFQIGDSNRYDRYYKKLKNYIFHIKTDD